MTTKLQLTTDNTKIEFSEFMRRCWDKHIYPVPIAYENPDAKFSSMVSFRVKIGEIHIQFNKSADGQNLCYVDINNPATHKALHDINFL